MPSRIADILATLDRAAINEAVRSGTADNPIDPGDTNFGLAASMIRTGDLTEPGEHECHFAIYGGEYFLDEIEIGIAKCEFCENEHHFPVYAADKKAGWEALRRAGRKA